MKPSTLEVSGNVVVGCLGQYSNILVETLHLCYLFAKNLENSLETMARQGLDELWMYFLMFVRDWTAKMQSFILNLALSAVYTAIKYGRKDYFPETIDPQSLDSRYK